MDDRRPPPVAPNSIGGATAPVVISRHPSECPISHVTVYNDRAEVSRLIRVTANEIGEGPHDIVIRGVSEKCDPDSFRVKGVGSFEILEVSFAVNYLQPPSDAGGKADQLREELKRLTAQRTDLDQFVARNVQLKAYSREYLSNLVARASASENGDVVSVTTMHQAMEFFKSQDIAINGRINETRDRLVLIAEHINKVEAELATVDPSRNARKASRDITISINVTTSNTYLELPLAYVVSGASWQPSYDMRLSCQEQAMTLVYYGLVTQTTGEDWEGCNLSLSTAIPAIRGHPPALPSRTVVRGWGGPFTLDLQLDDACEMDYDRVAPRRASTARAMEASVRTNEMAGSSAYDINRAVFVQSDNKPHKVTIITLSFPATLVYYTAPSVSPHAYLQAKTRNESDYPLLGSDKMNVYVDGSFITKTELKAVNPGEEFSTYLGVDPTIKVEYRPAQMTERTIGWMTKTKQTSYEYSTVITNTKSSPACVFVADSVPKSSADQIKVDLAVPRADTITSVQTALGMDETKVEEISLTDTQLIDQLIGTTAGRSLVVQNPTTNNIVWMTLLAPSQKITLPLSYTVSHGVDVPVQFD